MRKHIFLFFLALIFLAACHDDVPKGIIQRDRMVKLMADVHIIDGSIYNLNEATADTLYKYGNDRYNKLFKSYQTDSTQFKNSLKYYTKQPEVLAEMYTNIIASLQAKNDSLTKVHEAKKPIRKKPITKPNALPKK